MTSLLVSGAHGLKGDLRIQGSKNAALPMLAAALLNRGTTKLYHCPKIADVDCMLDILKSLGCEAKWEEGAVRVDSSQADSWDIQKIYGARMRSSVFLMGALLARFGEVSLPYPGGCVIGRRPLDFHLAAFERMGCIVSVDNERISCRAKRLEGTNHKLPYPSVGATENIILASVMAAGMTSIENAAKEPEIIELCLLLNKMGADIHGMGTSKITIYGVHCLKDTEYMLASDRIVAGTYMAAAAVTAGDVRLWDVWAHDLKAVLQVFAEMGCGIVIQNKRVRLIGPQILDCVDSIYTRPFPGFPTDMQSQIMACLCTAKGISHITETVFEDRFKTAGELTKMGADILIENNRAVIRGRRTLYGTKVQAKDLRGGAALVIAGLSAEGDTIINDSIYIQRGYEDICRDMQMLGAQIEERKTG